MSPREAACEAQANPCEDTLDGLTVACREVATSGSGPIDLSLALCNLFGGITLGLHDRQVHTSEIETLSERLRALLGILAKDGVSESSRAAIVGVLEELRDLL